MAGEQIVSVATPSLPPAGFLVRRISGADEAALAPDLPGEATRLLLSLASRADGGAIDLATLPATLHDRLLAAIYRVEIGESATCRAVCGACDAPFEFELVLADLIAAQDAEALAAGAPDDDGRWAVAGTRVRAPTIADAATGDAATLVAALCDPPVDPSAAPAIAAFLERAAPLLALDLDSVCPHCAAAQRLAFDLPRFLVRAIANERPFLIRETHLIAARYGWSHAEIMALPRDDRRAYATLIESERSAALRTRVAG